VTLAWTPYALPYLAAALLTVGVFAYVRRFRESPVARPFSLLLASVAWWIAARGLRTLVVDLPGKLLMAKLGHLGLVCIGPAFLLVALRSADHRRRLGPGLRVLVYAVPVVLLGLMWTDPWHHGFYASVELDRSGPYPIRRVEYGPVFWLLLGHAYALIAWASALLVRKYLRSWRSYPLDVPLMLLGVAAPWATATLHLAGIEILPHTSLEPFGFVFMGLAWSLGFRRTGLFDVLRVGRTQVLEAMADGVLVADVQGRLLDCNRAARRVLGLGTLQPAAQAVDEVLWEHPRVVAALRGELESRDREGVTLSVDDVSCSFDLQVSPLPDPRGCEVGRILVLRDVSDRKQAEEELDRESARVRLMQQVAFAANEATSVRQALASCLRLVCESEGWDVGHVYFPSDGEARLVDAGLWYERCPERLAEVSASLRERPASTWSLAGSVFATREPEVLPDLGRAPQGPRTAAARAAGLASAAAFPVVLGREVPAVLEFASRTPIHDGPGLQRVLEHLGDVLGRVVERQRHEERIRDLAYYDGLTGLPNRQLFSQRLETALESAGRRGRHVALLFLDLDGFKTVNDTFGHSLGDRLLRQVADRFAAGVRCTDVVARPAIHPQPVARLGGDEFTVLLSEVEAPEDAASVAQRLIETLVKPVSVDGREIFASTSVGIAVFPQDGNDAETLIRNADAAMYEAKAVGPGHYRFYTSSMNGANERRLLLGARLHGALERGDLSLVFQPLRHARSGEIEAVETLLRWNDAELGPVSPAEFIPVAERNGLIGPIGAWVLQRACGHMAAWRRAGVGLRRIAVNVSGCQLRADGLEESVDRALGEAGLPGSCLELEITESALTLDDPFARERLLALKERGVSLALDDFGTGYSSLTHLREFPIDRIKIDRSFVDGVGASREDAALISAVVAMAHGLRLHTVAEGVETEEQARFLTWRGCDELQGYLFSRPVPEEELLRMLPREKPEEVVAAAD